MTKSELNISTAVLGLGPQLLTIGGALQGSSLWPCHVSNWIYSQHGGLWVVAFMTWQQTSLEKRGNYQAS